MSKSLTLLVLVALAACVLSMETQDQETAEQYYRIHGVFPPWYPYASAAYTGVRTYPYPAYTGYPAGYPAGYVASVTGHSASYPTAYTAGIKSVVSSPYGAYPYGYQAYPYAAPYMRYVAPAAPAAPVKA